MFMVSVSRLPFSPLPPFPSTHRTPPPPLPLPFPLLPCVHPVKRRLVLRALGIRAIMLLYAVVMDVLLPDHNATVRKAG